SCDRHLRGSETHCPFCGEEVSVVSIARPRRWKNLGRAAILGLASVTVAACNNGGSDEPDPGDTGGGEDDGQGGDDMNGDDDDDMSGDDDMGSDNGGSGEEDDPGQPVALYGVPAPY
ncbi:MAG: hypothetical protein AB7P00_42815, partial [Sandaracinaceae bacterium]